MRLPAKRTTGLSAACPSQPRRCRPLLPAWSAVLAIAATGTACVGADELCLTGNARGNRNFAVPFKLQPAGAKPLFDGSHLDSLSVGFPRNALVVLGFAEPVRVSRVAVVCYNDPQRTYNAALRGRVIARGGGTVVGTSPWVPLDADAQTLCGTDGHLVLGAEASLPLGGTRAADILVVEVQKKPDATQSLVREVAVWGIPERLASARPVPMPFRAAENTYSSIRVTWPVPPKGTAYVRVRHRPKGAPAWQTSCFTASPGLLHWLRPDAAYEVVAEAVGPGSGQPVGAGRQLRSGGGAPGPPAAGSGPARRPDLPRAGSGPARRPAPTPDLPRAGSGPAPGPAPTSNLPSRGARPAPQVVRLPHPLAQRTMGDALGMNFYPGGGGAHQAQADETANTLNMIRLMREAGVRHVRWWVPSPGAATLYAEAGMALMPHATFTDPAGYARLAETTGAWLTATQNEPDFSNTFAEDFARAFIPARAAARRFSPLMLVAGPAVGGELVGPGSDYLAAGYAAGLRDAVDVLDLHPYGKMSTPLSRGGVPGGPEGLLASLASCREMMRKAGDPSRPIIASESGHPTHEGPWHMPPSSYERQAQWIVRTHLLLVASGVRRLFWYAFQDEGTDRRNPEHCFGIVDWHGKPKPAYHTYRTMARLLGGTRCEGLEPALKPPLYGVRCARPGGYVTVLWDAGGTGEVRVRPDSGITGVLSLTGGKLPIPSRVGSALVLAVDESVRYVYSARPLRVVAQRRIRPPIEPRVHLTLVPSTVRVRPGQAAQWRVRLASEFDCPVRVTLDCGHPWDGTPPRREMVLAPRGRSEVIMSLDAPAVLKPQIVSWDVRCRYQPEGARGPAGEFRRALFFEVPK